MAGDQFLRWSAGHLRPPRGPQRSLLWPVHVWTVMAPEIRGSGLNVFQEAILGLLNTGMRDRREIADSLDLDDALVAFIIATQLQPSQWVDSQQRLTPLGKEVLEGTTSDESNLVVQYAFQDAITGGWMPRLSVSLPEVVPTISQASSPEFVVNFDSGERIRPYVMRALRHEPHADKAAAKQALAQFLRDIRRAKLDEAEYVDDAIGDDFDFVGRQSRPAFVWCEVFRDERDLQPWLISDPWRLTPAAPWLREPLMTNLVRFPHLGNRISELLPDAADGSLAIDEYLKQLDLRVELELAGSFPHLENHPLLRQHFARLLRQLRRIEEQPRLYQEDLASLAQESMSALEALLKWLLETWPANATNWPERDRVGAEHFCTGYLRNIVGTQAAGILGGLMAKDVRLAALRRDRPLKALLAAALLSVYERTDHPFIDLPASSLQFGQLLAYLDVRNKAAHASGRALDPELTMAMARFALEWQAQFKQHF